MNEIISGILSVLLIAILISVVFFYAFNTKGPWGSFWTFFLVILFCVWIANLWIRPAGPIFYGIGWIILATTGLLVALLLAAVPSAHSHQKEVRTEKKQDVPDPESETRYQNFSRTTATISGIFWILMVILLVIILLGYIF